MQAHGSRELYGRRTELELAALEKERDRLMTMSVAIPKLEWAESPWNRILTVTDCVVHC